jgi:hypothetical protein
MNALDTIARRHAEVALASVADAIPPKLDLVDSRISRAGHLERNRRQWIVAVAVFLIVILTAIPVILSRRDAPVVSPPSITTVPDSTSALDPGSTYSGLSGGVPIPLPELTAAGWQISAVTPTGELLEISLAPELGPFERVTYWPILHVLQGDGGGLNMLLAHGAAESEVAQSVAAGKAVTYLRSEPQDGGAGVSHWQEVGREYEVDIITVTWGRWVLGIYDVLGGRVWGQQIADALTWNETAEGFLTVDSSDGAVVVKPQSAVVLTFWTAPETGFSLRIAPTCAASYTDEAVFEGDSVLDDSGKWCVSGSYEVVATAEGQLEAQTLDLVRDSLIVRERHQEGN